ncbi:FG-GAP repeat domain-containing protein, partial [Candidatus Auribacterota bacterium]
MLCALFVSLLLGLLAVPALADDPLNDGYPDIVIGNNRSGSSTYYDNSYVYWGNSEAQYASKNIFATMGAIGNSVADLNNDGYMDIVYSNYHDNSGHFELNSYIYWGAESNPYSSSTLLPTIGAIGNSVADLNNDGYLDIVFSNHKNDAGAHPINSYIYWGSGSGYSTSSRSLVPVLGGVGNAVTDIDNDGYLDIAFANLHDNSSYNINSYIYWGSSSGYSTSSRSQLATHGATAVSVGDLNNDGYSDVVFSNSTTADPTYNINSYVYWGGESRSFSSKTDLPTSLAHNSTLSDLNSDGYLDIVFSNYYNGSSGNINSYIYWGSSSGYSTSSRMGLPTKFALGNAVSDLNSDGYLDIVFATNIENDNFNTNSIIYWGAESGYSASSKSLLASMGAYGITIADTNILYANQAYGDTLPLWVTQNDYDADILGTAEYQFIALKNELLNEGALDFSDEEIAQLAKLYFDQVGTVEIDGTTWRYYSDEIGGHGVPEAWYDGDYYFQMGSGVTTAEGEIPEPSTVVMMVVLLVGLGVVYRRKFGKPVIARSEATKQSQRSARSKEIASSLTFLAMVVIILSLSAPTANAGTLEDGEPDIIFANSFDWGTFQFDPNSYIYWGAQTNPFSSKTELYTKGAYTCLAADLNNDGYRDPIFLNYFDNPVNNSYIYWGAATSPYSSRTDIWTDSQPGGVSSADLNDDGYVDIVISHQYDTDWYTNSYIYWGAASNPYSSKMELPTVGGTGNTVGDLNDDGYLDIVIANFYDGG